MNCNLTIVNLITQEAAKWLRDRVCWTKGRFTAVGGTEWGHTDFITLFRTVHNGKLIIYFWNFPLVYSDPSWPQVTENLGTITMDKGSPVFPCSMYSPGREKKRWNAIHPSFIRCYLKKYDYGFSVLDSFHQCMLRFL